MRITPFPGVIDNTHDAARSAVRGTLDAIAAIACDARYKPKIRIAAAHEVALLSQIALKFKKEDNVCPLCGERVKGGESNAD